MKDFILNPDFIKFELEDLEFMSLFIIYDRFGYSKKKLKKCKFTECLTEDNGDLW